MRIEQPTIFLLTQLREAMEGKILPAAFQRSYAWDREDVEALWTSIMKGYPIGGLTMWRPDRELPLDRMGRNRLGPIEASGSPWSVLLLDGQNRLASLAWSMVLPGAARPDPADLSVQERETWDPAYQLVCDYETRSIRFVPLAEAETLNRFPVALLENNGLLNRHMRALFNAGQMEDAFFAWVDTMQTQLRETRVNSVLLNGLTPAEAVDAFQHIGKVGKPMQPGDLAAAMEWFSNEPEMDAPGNPRRP